jgi:hypothetical protein
MGMFIEWRVVCDYEDADNDLCDAEDAFMVESKDDALQYFKEQGWQVADDDPHAYCKEHHKRDEDVPF